MNAPQNFSVTPFRGGKRMAQQLSIVFPDAPCIPRARNTDPSTSHAAAGGIGITGALHLSELVVAALQEHGPMTTHEIAELTGQTVVTISPRIKPLREAGLVAATGDRREKRSVWKAL